MKQDGGTFIVEKNRRRAFWALVIVGFTALVSLVLLITGLVGGESGIIWMPVWLGTLGLLSFGASAALVVRTMRAPWHLAVSPAHLILHTPTYHLQVPWSNVVGIAVDEVNHRLGCALIFEDAASVAQGARFVAHSNRPEFVTDAQTMLTRMGENYKTLGYHLAIPGRILEKGPEELAEFLTRACTGQLWQQEAG